MIQGNVASRLKALVASAAAAAGLLAIGGLGPAPSGSEARLADQSDGRDWASYGATYGEQHYSPLNQIADHNVGKLGLSWFMDLPAVNTVTQPLAVDGVLYFAIGHSLIHAVDARSGKLLWKYDPKVLEVAKVRSGWGSRGLAWWNGKIYTATKDGRLIALDARSGKALWSVQTLPAGEAAYITGAPRAFNGKIFIGDSGADMAAVRGYVAAYDAETGKQLWRFHTVPGDPSKGFENTAMEMAARTWFGDWWKFGGGGTVWNAMTYDKEQNTVLIGVGNGAPWNHKIRSQGKGDNLFLASIVALDASTGAYKWHYQVNPGETWDYVASMDIQLADLKIGGADRKVLVHAPKNGFFYVIDRTNGKLISAEPFARVTWASKIDVATGRPVEHPDARFPDGKAFLLRPFQGGAHTWLPMAFSPRTGLTYIPVVNIATVMSDKGIDTSPNWTRYPNGGSDGGVNVAQVDEPEAYRSDLLAWDPVTQKEAWRVVLNGPSNGGLMATGGNLVFQGQVDGTFNAYDARDGRKVWTFQAQAPVLAPPITYWAGGRQYVTVLTGNGTGVAAFGKLLAPFNIQYRTQARRVLTFALDGKTALPAPSITPLTIPPDPTFDPAIPVAVRGAVVYGRRCASCHGADAIAAGGAPDLRASSFIHSAEAFAAVVRDGALLSRGMPKFPELDDATLADLRQHLRARAAAGRAAATAGGEMARNEK